MKRILSYYCGILLLVSIISVFGSYQITSTKESILRNFQKKIDANPTINTHDDYIKLKQSFEKQVYYSNIFHIVYVILIVMLLVVVFIYKRIDKAKEIKGFAKLSKEIQSLSLVERMKTTIINTKTEQNTKETKPLDDIY